MYVPQTSVNQGYVNQESKRDATNSEEQIRTENFGVTLLWYMLQN
jgi:hypothetical protein